MECVIRGPSGPRVAECSGFLPRELGRIILHFPMRTWQTEQSSSCGFHDIEESLYTSGFSLFFSMCTSPTCWCWGSGQATPNMTLWPSEYFLTEGIWDVAGAGRTFRPSFGAGHKTLVSTQEERNMLISKDKGTQRGIWMNRLCEDSPIYYS